jgi:Oxidoreductase molybdopterin binding domain
MSTHESGAPDPDRPERLPAAPSGPERAPDASSGDASPPVASADLAPVDPAPPAAERPTGAASAPVPARVQGTDPGGAEPDPAPAPRESRAPVAATPRAGFVTERPPTVVERPTARLAAQTRRDFLFWSLGVVAAVTLGYWLLPARARRRLLPGLPHDRLDTLAARVGLTTDRRERSLDRALTFDDDVAEALASPDRMVRTYTRADARPLRNNYDGRTPGPEYLPDWRLSLSGLASGRTESLTIDELARRLTFREQGTRLVCVEGWSAVAWWGGFRFADLLAAFPPATGARWAALVSAVNLDGAGRPDPYYVSLDLVTARHPQTLLATRLAGAPLTLEHGAPLRLVAPMKLGLKNIKAITSITYQASEPPDYWNERGYSKYDGL